VESRPVLEYMMKQKVIKQEMYVKVNAVTKERYQSEGWDGGRL
jgi:hypothetical protein